MNLQRSLAAKKEMRMTVLPIFHYVEPSDVRKQMETFAQAFVKHEEKENKERVEKWRDALTQADNLRGWHLKDSWYFNFDLFISLNIQMTHFIYLTLFGTLSKFTYMFILLLLILS